MKTFLKCFLIMFLNIQTNFIFSQSNIFDCGFISQSSSGATGSIFGGLFKPNRTDSSGGSVLQADAYFPVLVVFVQFKNEASDPRNTWPQNSAPVYLNNIIAKDKDTIGDWWNFYDEQTQILSDHWAEISRGKFHVISPTESGVNTAFSVILQYETSHYDSMGAAAAQLEINKEIWISLNSQGLTDWRAFDRWKYNQSTGYFEFKDLGEGDNIVDMIYKIHKSRNNGGLPDYAGYAKLSWDNSGTEYLVDTANNIKINYGFRIYGSGITVSFRGQLAQYIGTIGHEHGHYLFSNGHSTYSRVSYGFGYDFFYSPADMILNGYMTPSNAAMNATNALGDFSSRNSVSGNLLKISVQGNEFFLLASRNKISKWDRIMSGDAAQIDQYGDESQYGKGLYIYHVPEGINFPSGDISQQDMECADGLFEFEYGGQATQQVVHDCFTSGSNAWYYYNKKKVIYENDSSNLFLTTPPPGHPNIPKGDGISFRWYWGYIYPNYIYHIKWWGEGEQPTNPCNIGTDRLFTNNSEAYTRFDVGGDRYDPWKPGYNEVFSPYSSPNTNTWSNENSGIFIWYYDYSGTTPPDIAYIKIYKAGYSGLSEDSILHLTPPSRPMGLRIMPCDSISIIDGYKRIKIKWNHNMEPDMRNMIAGWLSYSKAYRIYRSIADDMQSVPPDALQNPEQYYEEIATVNIDETDVPEFTDYYSLSVCNLFSQDCPPYCPYPVRYRVQAVDKYGDESVLSDFVNTTAVGTGEDEGSDNIFTTNDEKIPKEYSLIQNYPNPFNPSTRISYAIPKEGFVTLKIYDILGKEVMTLVNENMQAGYYDVEFNASSAAGGLASGLYFYTIKSGSFVETKRMLLIK
ncbi:MAG: hypothetical protein HGGPFJEG_02714 [Ignavibacteria bacterium]|nr:hypothetical protein [Ignavibacteria bacterium]